VNHTLHIPHNEIEADMKSRIDNSPAQEKPFDKGVDEEKMERSFRDRSAKVSRDIDHDRER